MKNPFVIISSMWKVEPINNQPQPHDNYPYYAVGIERTVSDFTSRLALVFHINASGEVDYYLIMEPDSFKSIFEYRYSKSESTELMIEKTNILRTNGFNIFTEEEFKFYTDKKLTPDEMELVNKGQKLQATKDIKDRLGIGLKEAKELVDAYADLIK